DGTVALRAVNTKCLVAACGECIYDFRFDIDGFTPGADLPVKFGELNCPTDTETHWDYQGSVHIGTSDQGVVCRYLDRGLLEWNNLCGSANLICGTDHCTATCPAGLTCTAIDGASDTRCLKPCSADADCGSSGVLTCKDSFCRVGTTL